MSSKYLVMAGEVPTIMCETHAKMFEQMMMVGDLPHTIVEMDDDNHVCQVCELKEIKDEINKPKIILPGEF